KSDVGFSAGYDASSRGRSARWRSHLHLVGRNLAVCGVEAGVAPGAVVGRGDLNHSRFGLYVDIGVVAWECSYSSLELFSESSPDFSRSCRLARVTVHQPKLSLAGTARWRSLAPASRARRKFRTLC